MKSIHSFWRQWLHLENLIQKRKKTFIETMKMSQDEVEKMLKIEFKDEYPHTYQNYIINGFFKNVQYIIDANSFKIEENDNIFSISFFDKQNQLLATSLISICLHIENDESIFTVIDGNKCIPLDNEFTAYDYLDFLNIL